MLKLVVLCCVVAVWLQVPDGANAECCRKQTLRFVEEIAVNVSREVKTNVCGDCTTPTFYCSYGGCNILGCNCDGGCRTGECFGAKRDLRMRSEEDARDVIRAADVNGDGRMSVEEAKLHLASLGLPTSHVERALEEMDVDQDLFFSEQEIDSSLM